MKQRISAEDLAELTPEQQERLREWWTPEVGDYIVHDTQGIGCLFGDVDIMDKTHMLPRLSIGQCIELLKSRWTDRVNISESLGKYRVQTINAVVQNHAYIKERVYVADELIDALFATVKEVL